MTLRSKGVVTRQPYARRAGRRGARRVRDEPRSFLGWSGAALETADLPSPADRRLRRAGRAARSAVLPAHDAAGAPRPRRGEARAVLGGDAPSIRARLAARGRSRDRLA